MITGPIIVLNVVAIMVLSFLAWETGETMTTHPSYNRASTVPT